MPHPALPQGPKRNDWAPVESAERRVVIRRDQLSGIASYAGTLLHEIGHMVSGSSDGTLDFEQVLSELLGRVAATVLWRP